LIAAGPEHSDRRAETCAGRVGPALTLKENKLKKDMADVHQTVAFTFRYRRGKRTCDKGKGSPYSITEHRVAELIPVLGR